MCEHGISHGCKICSDEITARNEWDAVNVSSVPAKIITDDEGSQYAFMADPFLHLARALTRALDDVADD